MARVSCAVDNRLKSIELRLHAPHAKRVSVAGTFNNWDTKAFTAKRDALGVWRTKLNLKPGRYEYKFFVDSAWWNDPSCRACVPNAFGTSNCIIEVK